MTLSGSRCLLVESLADGIPVLTGGSHWYYINKCLIALDSQGHTSGVTLTVDYCGSDQCFELLWDSEVTPELIKANADLVRTTEESACAIAFLLVRELTDFTAVEQARRFSGFDYFLSYKSRNDDLIFNNVAALEVTGILKSTNNKALDSRIKTKVDRLEKYKYSMPVFIVVVEHGTPCSRMVVWNESCA